MLTDLDDKSQLPTRRAAIAMSVLTLRLLENWNAMVHGNGKRDGVDLNSTMIVLAVVAIGAEKYLRSELDPSLQDLTTPMPWEHLSPCNVSSIASATGMNRETARRKTRALIDAGILEKTPDGGIRIAPDFAGSSNASAIVKAQVEACERTTRQLQPTSV